MRKLDRWYEQSMKTYAPLTALVLLAVVSVFSAEKPAPGEQRVVIRAKPQFVEDRGVKWLVLPLDGGTPARIYYSEGSLPDKELEFAVWRAERVLWRSEDGEEHTVQEPVLDSIKDGRKVYFDAGVCRIHRIQMKRGEVEIHYGLLAIDPKAWKTYSGGPGWVGGGCVIMDGAPSKARGYICKRCVAAYQKWSEEERKKQEKCRARQEAESGN